MKAVFFSFCKIAEMNFFFCKSYVFFKKSITFAIKL